jgi:4-amino-4-deoxy-L-arabinose transferase-like glycosyltransferase
MQETRRSAGGPGILVLLLCVVAPPIGLLAWIIGSPERPTYLRSRWVRAGLALLLLGSTPLLTIILAAQLGLWPDPNPNPIGPGLLFFGSAVVATVCLAVGAVRVWLDLRRPAT